MKGRNGMYAAEPRRDSKAPRHHTAGSKKQNENQLNETEKMAQNKENHHKLRYNKSNKRFDGNQQSRVHWNSDNSHNKENQKSDGDGSNNSTNRNSNFSGDDANFKVNNLGYNNNNNNSNSSRYNSNKNQYKINRLNGNYKDHRQNHIQAPVAPVVISDSSNSDFTFDVTADDVMLSKKTFMESYSQFLSIRKEPSIDAYLHYNYLLTGHIFRQHSMQVLATLQSEMNPNNNVDKPPSGHGSVQSASSSSASSSS